MPPITLPRRRFFYLRHGQTDWNAQGLWQGQIDIPLNALGEQQAHGAAKLLANQGITRIIASPLLRAHKTAEIVAQHLGLAPFDVDGELKERSYGAFEGKSYRDVIAQYNLGKGASLEPYLPADAETWDALQLRIQKAIAYWLNGYPQDVLLFVGHGATYRAFHESYLPDSLHAGNCIPFHFEPQGEAWKHTTLAA